MSATCSSLPRSLPHMYPLRGWTGTAAGAMMAFVPFLMPRARFMLVVPSNGRPPTSQALLSSAHRQTSHLTRARRSTLARVCCARDSTCTSTSKRQRVGSVAGLSANRGGEVEPSSSIRVGEAVVLEKATTCDRDGSSSATEEGHSSSTGAGIAEAEEVLTQEAWTERAEAHRRRVRAITDGSVHHDRGDPIFNFLFEYYHFKPRILLQWTPGIDVYLLGADPTLKGSPLPQKGWEPGSTAHGLGGGRYNPLNISEKSRRALKWQRDFLLASSSRPPVFHCFGLHEWAMLYRPPDVKEDGRSIHQTLPLRVSQEEINAMVEGRGGSMACTHFDAFRFFTPEARPLNSISLSRDTQVQHDQPGCVHANMDLFKWALQMWPMLPSESMIDALELAVSCRMLDMRASPYDLSAYGKSPYDGRGGGKLGGLPSASWDPSPVRIETEEGRREYQAGQLELYRRSMPVRRKLLRHMDRLLEAWAA